MSTEKSIAYEFDMELESPVAALRPSLPPSSLPNSPPDDLLRRYQHSRMDELRARLRTDV